MPHSTFKERSHMLNSGVGKCPCGQTFDYTSERDLNMKLRMHCKFCSKPVEGSQQIRKPKKVMTLKEQQKKFKIGLSTVVVAQWVGTGVMVTRWCKLKVRAQVEIYTDFFSAMIFISVLFRPNGFQ